MAEHSLTVEWDEKTIAEHDLLRGTRQKIDEPDTPFLSAQSVDSDFEYDDFHLGGTDLNAVAEALNEAKRVSERTAKLIASDDLPVEVEEEGRAVARRSSSSQGSFAERRKAHYNEFEAVKAMRARLAMQQDDEDSE